MRRSGLIIVFIILGNFLYAQRGLQLNESSYNFGTVKVWDNPPAIFTFENTSFDPIYILAPKASRNVVVEYPRNRIESGEKGEIRIYYYTENTGNFSEEVIIYSSGSNEPIKLNVKGQIKAMADNALTSCPNFDQNGKIQAQEFLLEGVVVDKITKEPLKNAVIKFAGIESIYTNGKGEFKQKIPVGLYVSLAKAEGYRDLNLMVGVRKDMEKVVYELLPLEIQPLEKDTIPALVIDTLKADTQAVVIVDTIPDENPAFSIKEYKANNIVFLIDVSGSMKQNGKIDSLKMAMLYMAEELRSVDRISVITFATSTNEIMTNIPGSNKEVIVPTINNLQAKGTTNGVLGLEKAFAEAIDQYIEGGNNQVIVVTDGIFNGNNSNPQEVKALIKAYSDRGIILSVVGFGKDQQAVQQMTKMAETGKGSFIPFDNGANARPKLIEEIKTRSHK
jgi:Mg-chelatase subunit ChlD